MGTGVVLDCGSRGFRKSIENPGCFGAAVGIVFAAEPVVALGSPAGDVLCLFSGPAVARGEVSGDVLLEAAERLHVEAGTTSLGQCVVEKG